MRRYGNHHHRTRYSDALVENARTRHDHGQSPAAISQALGVPMDTLNDWIYYRTRTRVA